MSDPSLDDPDDGDDGGPPRRTVIIGFVFVVVLGIAGYFLVEAVIDMVRLQDCVATGRRDC